MRIAPIVCLSTSVLALVASNAVGQESSLPPAHISFVEGSATLERNGEIEMVALNMPVIEGDRIRTAAGRLQIAFPDGSAVDLDPNSEVEYLGAARVRIYAGTIENRSAVAVTSPSAPYLPADSLSYAADLDQNGTWQNDTTYGDVWYPTVAVGWRPYYYGYWSSVPAYGWTWIGYNRWAWPTHHYGRWGYAHSRWFWIPGRTYANAWVSWGTAPGYVSWCPLGFDSRPVAALSVGYSQGWNAWTIVPRDHFGWRGYPAHRYAIEPYRLAASTPFIVQRTPPAALSVRGPGTYARTSQPERGAAQGVTRAPTSAREGFSRARPERDLSAEARRATAEGISRATPAVPRYATPTGPRETGGAAYRSSPSYSIRGGGAGIRGPAGPPVRTEVPPRYQPASPSPNINRPIDQGGRAPQSTYRPSAPQAYQPPAPSPARQSGGRGGGHTAGAPHAERGPSGSSHGGSNAGSRPNPHGGSNGGSQGTAVRRPR